MSSQNALNSTKTEGLGRLSPTSAVRQNDSVLSQSGFVMAVPSGLNHSSPVFGVGSDGVETPAGPGKRAQRRAGVLVRSLVRTRTNAVRLSASGDGSQLSQLTGLS